MMNGYHCKACGHIEGPYLQDTGMALMSKIDGTIGERIAALEAENAKLRGLLIAARGYVAFSKALGDPINPLNEIDAELNKPFRHPFNIERTSPDKTKR